MDAIDPGRFDRRIVIQQLTAGTPAQDAYGEPSETWTTYANAWAEKLDVGGREKYQTSGRQAEVDTVFRIHYQAGITHKMRIYYNSTAYNILFINELGRKQYLEIRATAMVD
jgi:SPP1 family predicted phage head-tail adaptor